MKWKILLWLVPALAGCSLVTVTDPYGNRYGSYYDHGQVYGWQLATCEQSMVSGNVPLAQRKLAMRCCMGRRGVPIDDPRDCGLG